MINRLTQAGAPVYCDQGPHEGLTRVDIRGSVYLSAEELQRWNGASGLVLSFPAKLPDKEEQENA